MAHTTKSRHEILIGVLGDPIQAMRVTSRFTEIVRDSVLRDARHGSEGVKTQAEVARRTGILYDWFILLRNEMGYSTTHALDVLPQVLQARLSGVDWTPAHADRTWGGE